MLKARKCRPGWGGRPVVCTENLIRVNEVTESPKWRSSSKIAEYSSDGYSDAWDPDRLGNRLEGPIR